MTDCKGCEQCASTCGDQAEHPEAVELFNLRSINAELRREIERRDELLEGSSPAAIAELVASGSAALLEEEREYMKRGCSLVVADSVADEREECARIAEGSYPPGNNPDPCAYDRGAIEWGLKAARAIRARK